MAAEVRRGMNWAGVLALDVAEVEDSDSRVDALYQFLVGSQPPNPGECQWMADPASVGKMFAVVRTVLKVKGEEAQVAFEELSAREAVQPTGASERDLLDQIVHLEKEVRHRDATIDQLRERGVQSPGNEARYLREQLDDLKRDLSEKSRLFDQERAESERLSSECSAERLRSRQLEREVDRLRQNLEDYKRQLEWHRERDSGSASQQRLGEPDFKERLRKKDLEIAEQLDKMEELLNARDSLERQLHELTVQLGHVEEQRLVAIRDMEKMRVALMEADQSRDETETRSRMLEGQVQDLEGRLQEHVGADEQIMAMLSSKSKEWEALLSSKQAELEECRKKVVRLEGQLRVAQRDTSRAASIKLKQQLQERDAQVEVLQGQLSEAAQSMESLSSQLQQARARSGTGGADTARLHRVSELQGRVERLQRELEQEVLRREEAESSKEEKDVELTQARGRLGEYERGEYGLHEAVQEIKTKKEEIAVRDKDIAELTQQVNGLENQLNQLSEENEVLRGRLGVGLEEKVDLSGLRQRKKAELEQLRTANRMLKRELERLEEEKLGLRRQLLDQAINKGRSAAGLEGVGVATPLGGSSSLKQERRLQELTAQVKELREACDTERQQKEAGQREASRLHSQLGDCQDQVKQYESALRELSQGRSSGEEQRTSEALEKLITMLEARSADGKYDVTLQLKSEVSRLSGQNAELRSRLQVAEQEGREATRQLERRLIQVESLQKDVETWKKSSCGFQAVALPEGMPAASSDVITSLNEHLLCVLSELRSKEEVVVQSQEALERVQRKLAVIIHQQGVLYQEYLEAKGAWQTEREGLVQERAGLLAQREQDQLQLQEFKNLQEMLAADPDSQRQRMGELSRKVTILRVNEKTLSRRYTLLHEAEAAHRKENGKLRQDLVTLEKAVTERMGYLERFKEAAQFKLSGLQHQLSENIPSSLLERANREHDQLVAKYQQLLQRQTSHTADARALEQLQAEVRALAGQLESVKQELAVEKQKCRLLEQTSASAATDGPGAPGGGNRGLAERLATLEMKELNERQRADLAATRLKQAQEAVSQLEGRNADLEERFGELSLKLLQVQAREAELEDKLADCLTREEKESLEVHIQSLRQSEAKLKQENSQLKEVAEVARQQNVAMEMWQKSHDSELSSLRHQLLDLQMQSDEKTVIGKLHHQLVMLQVSEASAARNLEEANRKVMKLEAALLRCEHERDELSTAVFQVRAEAQGKIRQLRCTVQSLRRQFSGALPLAQQEKHAELVAKLREDRVESERLREETRKERAEAEDKLSQLQLQHSNLQELIASLGDSKNMAARLTEWHAKLGEMRLQEMKLTRTVERLKDQVRHLEGLVSSSEKAFARLEQDLVTVTKDYESSQLSWEQRELELEQQVDHLRQQQRKAASAAQQLQDAAGSLPDSQQPVSSQLEQAISTLQQNSHTISNLKQQVRRSEEHADKLEKALTRAQSELLKNDREVSELRLQLSRAQDEGVGIKLDHMRSHDVASGEESRKTLKVAQETIEQLRALVSQKGSLAEKYQRLLQEARQELQAATEAHKTETASLLQQIHSQADTAFFKLKEAALSAVNAPRPELPTDRQLARLQELEELVVEQEGANAMLAEQVKQVRQELAQAERAWQAREAGLQQEMKELKKTHQATVEELQQSVRERSSRVAELEQELEVVEGELSAAQEAASHAPSRSMRNLVEKLRGQLAIKEKQHKALSAALLQVRSDLVETAQQTVEGQARQELQEANVQQLLDKKTAQMQDHMQELSGRMDKLRVRLEESQARESQAVEQLQRLEGELLEKTSTVARLESELRQQRRVLEQAQGREEARTQEVKELRGRLEQPPETRERGEAGRGQKQAGARVSTKQGEVAMTAEASSQVDSKHSSVEVLRWEEGKRWQRRVEQLKIRLSERGKEVEVGQKQIVSLKEMLARADREKGVLQARLRASQRAPSEVPAPQKSSTSGGRKNEVAAPDLEEEHMLKSRVFELENQVQQLQRDLNTERLSEPRQLEARNSQLLKTIEALEAQLQQQHPGSSSDLRCLRETENRLQGELLQSQRENMRLRFECEQAGLEVPRLKARMEDQQCYIEALKSASATASRAAQAEGNTRASESREAGSGGHRVVELERVIAAMRKVVERLQRENESLRKPGGKQTRAQGTTQVGLEAENKRLKAELEKLLADPSPNAGDSSGKSPYAKIVAENERIRRELKKEVEKSEQFQLSLTTLEVQNSKLKEKLRKAQDYTGTRAGTVPSSEERIEVLQAEVEKKTAMLMEVKKHLREAAERERAFASAAGDSQLTERYMAILKEKEALQQQVTHLTKELEAFDPSFFEEIEDLKYNHQEAVRKNIQYEELLAKLTQQHGFSVSELDLPGSQGLS